ncbi:MAG: hypothetical protein P4L76_06570 [Beijerinckiaceae bacterium]|nr:hypothetical protein [Beijerinckiaceae bacterium]
MSKISIRAMLLCLALTGAGTGIAQAAGGCVEYANQAVISAAQNRDWGCGFHGLRWSMSFEEHFGWCRSVGAAAAYPERLERQRALHACRR